MNQKSLRARQLRMPLIYRVDQGRHLLRLPASGRHYRKHRGYREPVEGGAVWVCGV